MDWTGDENGSKRITDGGEDEAPSLPLGRRDTAEYIAELTSSLAALARASRFEVLAHLLDVAGLEAKLAQQRLAGRAGARSMPRR